MAAIVRVIFPWQSTFNQLELNSRWWHRLALVLFFLSLIMLFLISLLAAFGSFEPEYTTQPDITYWLIGTEGNRVQVTLGPPVTRGEFEAMAKQHAADPDKSPAPPPIGAQTLTAQAGENIKAGATLTAEITMPTGTTKEFIGKSDSQISATWKDALYRALAKAWLISAGIALTAVLFCSYLVQSLYRALVYVAYGSDTKRHMKHSNDPI